MSTICRLGWMRCLLVAVVLCACDAPEDRDRADAGAETRVSHDVSWFFADVTEAAGVAFVHFNDASPDRLLPETMGAGAAFCDVDGDGWADLYVVNGMSLTSSEPSPTGRLYRNEGTGQFRDVTDGSGLDVPFYGMGAAAGDVDEDGAIDVFVSAVGPDRLFRNRGDGRFEDVTAEAGLDRSPPGFSTSAAFLDYDRDGDLDLFVCRYVAWSANTDRECRPDGVHRAYCTPETYPAVSSQLWRNDGNDGSVRFTDVSAPAGIAKSMGKALGVVVFDHDEDGWPDLVVANDTERNFLFHNRRDGTFEEIGVEAGVAYSESGAARGGMGIDTGDLDGDGRDDIVIGNFSYEMAAFFRARPSGVYMDDAPRFGLGLPTLSTLAFGVRAVDLDGDGWDDVVVVNGHIEPDIERLFPGQAYAQLPQVLRNVDGERLEEVLKLGDLARPMVGRALAVGDYDHDGDPDLFVTQNGRPARLFRNDAAPADASWLRVRLTNAAGSPTPYGAGVHVYGDAAAEPTRVAVLRSGGSYLSASEPVLTLGLESIETIDSLVVRWPSGRRTVVVKPTSQRRIDVREPR